MGRLREVSTLTKLELRKSEDMAPQIQEDAHDNFSSVIGNMLP